MSGIERTSVYVLQETGFEGLADRDHKIHGVYTSLDMAMMELRHLLHGQEEFCPHYFSTGNDIVRVKFSEGRRCGDCYVIEVLPIICRQNFFMAEVPSGRPAFMSPKAHEAWDRAEGKP